MGHLSTWLAFDASGDTSSVALWVDGLCTIERSPKEKSRSDVLLPMMQTVLRQQNIELTGVDAIAYAHGPGSFTGLRLAASIAKSVAYALKKPLYSVSSLALAAYRFYQDNPEVSQAVTVAIDAKMDEYYLGCYQREHTGVSAIIDDVLCDQAQLATKQLSESVLITHSEADAIDVIKLCRCGWGAEQNPLDAGVAYVRGQDAWKTTAQQVNEQKTF